MQKIDLHLSEETEFVTIKSRHRGVLSEKGRKDAEKFHEK